MYVDNLAKNRKLHDHLTTTEKELKDSKDSLFQEEVKVKEVHSAIKGKENSYVVINFHFLCCPQDFRAGGVNFNDERTQIFRSLVIVTSTQLR